MARSSGPRAAARSLVDFLRFSALLLVAVAVGHLAYLNWTPATVWLFTFPVVVPLSVVIGVTTVIAVGASAIFYMGGYLAAREELRRAQREVVGLRDERRKILDLCESIELPIPFSSVVENNVVRAGPLRLGQFTARVRAEPRPAAAT